MDDAHPRVSGCTCLRVRKAARRVSQIYDSALAPHGLTITQYGLLAQLHASEGIGVGALAARLVMDPTTLTRNLRPMERRGLISLKPDPADRRVRLLHLTRRGRATYEAARPAWRMAQGHIEDRVGKQDTVALHGALDRLLERLSADA